MAEFRHLKYCARHTFDPRDLGGMLGMLRNPYDGLEEAYRTIVKSKDVDAPTTTVVLHLYDERRRITQALSERGVTEEIVRDAHVHAALLKDLNFLEEATLFADEVRRLSDRSLHVDRQTQPLNLRAVADFLDLLGREEAINVVMAGYDATPPHCPSAKLAVRVHRDGAELLEKAKKSTTTQLPRKVLDRADLLGQLGAHDAAQAFMDDFYRL